MGRCRRITSFSLILVALAQGAGVAGAACIEAHPTAGIGSAAAPDAGTHAASPGHRTNRPGEGAGECGAPPSGDERNPAPAPCLDAAVCALGGALAHPPLLVTAGLDHREVAAVAAPAPADFRPLPELPPPRA